MAENLGEAVVKISADITPLQKAVQNAEKAIEPLKKDQTLGNFKVNWGEGAGSLDEYNNYLQEATTKTNELSDGSISLEQALQQAGITAKTASEGIQQVSQVAETASEETSRLSNALSTMGTAIAHPVATASGAFSRLNEKIKESDLSLGNITKKMQTSKRAFMTWSFVIGATFGKALSTVAEFDENAKSKLEDLGKSWDRLFANLGSILQPVLGMLNAVVSAIADAVGWIGSLFGATVNYTTKLADLEKAQKEQEKTTEKLNDAYKEYSGTMANVGEQISEIQKNMARTTLEYRRNLKQILVNHEDTVNKLTQQIKEANDDYQRAVDERTAAFTVSQAKEEKEHQAKVDELMTQINFLQRYNNKYNQEKLSQLQFELAKENRLYQQQTEAERKELEVQLENEKAKNDAKVKEYSDELNEELSLLNKHRALLNSVRDEILLDEVENLQEQYRIQMDSYNKQIADAQRTGAEAATRWSEAYAKAMRDNDAIYKASAEIGEKTVNGMNEGFISRMGQYASQGGPASTLWGWLLGTDDPAKWFQQKGRAFRNLFTGESSSTAGGGGGGGGWADGGYTGQGSKYEVAGVVHKGEYVIPKEQVNQTTGQPKAFGGVNVNITMNGAFATSAVERRKFAQDIRNELNNIDFAKLGA